MERLGGLVAALGELGGQGDGVGVGLDANGLLEELTCELLVLVRSMAVCCYLVVAVTLIFAAVLVDKVQWVARELDTAGLLPLDEEGAVGAYIVQFPSN